MNRIKQVIFLFTIIISLNILVISCCTKKACDYEGNIIYSINLYSFDSSEIDTVRVIKFYRGNNFADPIDSFEVYSYNFTGNDFYLPEEIKVEFDYIIRTGYKSYKLYDFRFSRLKCSSCFPFNLRKDYYYSLDSYMVNDSRIYNNNLYIDKYSMN